MCVADCQICGSKTHVSEEHQCSRCGRVGNNSHLTEYCPVDNFTPFFRSPIMFVDQINNAPIDHTYENQLDDHTYEDQLYDHTYEDQLYDHTYENQLDDNHTYEDQLYDDRQLAMMIQQIESSYPRLMDIIYTLIES